MTWFGCQGWCPALSPSGSTERVPTPGVTPCSQPAAPLGSTSSLPGFEAKRQMPSLPFSTASCKVPAQDVGLQRAQVAGGSPAAGHATPGRVVGAWVSDSSPLRHPVGWALSQHRGKPLHTGNEVGTGLLPKPHSVHTAGLPVTTPAARLVYTTSSFPTCLPRRNSEKINIAVVKGSQELVGRWGEI